ncbi:uncharacterized protein LOC134222534 [Armigeres subalbatus]|uniref:uncharacterized protein LOC134222534 n=1 Tax=Armigeres subalbatus TaxID=124917 RepID=UPI002ED25D6E
MTNHGCEGWRKERGGKRIDLEGSGPSFQTKSVIEAGTTLVAVAAITVGSVQTSPYQIAVQPTLSSALERRLQARTSDSFREATFRQHCPPYKTRLSVTAITCLRPIHRRYCRSDPLPPVCRIAPPHVTDVPPYPFGPNRPTARLVLFILLPLPPGRIDRLFNYRSIS